MIDTSANSVGKILVQRGILAAEALEQAVRLKEQQGGSLAVNLVITGAVDDKTLAAFYAERFGVGRVEEEHLGRVDREVFSLIPVEIIYDAGVFPLFREGDDGERLVVGIIDPSEPDVLDEASFYAALELEPRVMTIGQMARHYLRLTGKPWKVDWETVLSRRRLGEEHHAHRRPNEEVELTDEIKELFKQTEELDGRLDQIFDADDSGDDVVITLVNTDSADGAGEDVIELTQIKRKPSGPSRPRISVKARGENRWYLDPVEGGEAVMSSPRAVAVRPEELPSIVVDAGFIAGHDASEPAGDEVILLGSSAIVERGSAAVDGEPEELGASGIHDTARMAAVGEQFSMRPAGPRDTALVPRDSKGAPEDGSQRRLDLGGLADPQPGTRDGEARHSEDIDLPPAVIDVDLEPIENIEAQPLVIDVELQPLTDEGDDDDLVVEVDLESFDEDHESRDANECHADGEQGQAPEGVEAEGETTAGEDDVPHLRRDTLRIPMTVATLASGVAPAPTTTGGDDPAVPIGEPAPLDKPERAPRATIQIPALQDRVGDSDPDPDDERVNFVEDSPRPYDRAEESSISYTAAGEDGDEASDAWLDDSLMDIIARIPDKDHDATLDEEATADADVIGSDDGLQAVVDLAASSQELMASVEMALVQRSGERDMPEPVSLPPLESTEIPEVDGAGDALSIDEPEVDSRELWKGADSSRDTLRGLPGLKLEELRRGLLRPAAGLTFELEANDDEVPERLRDVLLMLDATNERDEVGRLTLEHLSEVYERVILFSIRGMSASVWLSAGPSEAPVVAPTGSIHISAIACLSRPIRENACYLGPVLDPGPVPEEPEQLEGVNTLRQMLDGEMPLSVIVTPLSIKQRQIALIYCDDGPGRAVTVDRQGMALVRDGIEDALQRIIMLRKRRH